MQSRIQQLQKRLERAHVVAVAAWPYLFLAGRGSLDKLGPGQLVRFDTNNYQPIGNPITLGVTPNIIEVGQGHP